MGQSLQSLFLLHPEITYLNFGSFGACPKPIFEDYQKWQRELELEPCQFIKTNGPKYLQQSREALGNYLHCGADDLVYVTNPSYAVNIIAKSFALEPGDEVLTTDLEYGACDRTWKYYCQKAGAIYVRRTVSLPLITREAMAAEFCAGITANTKLIFISHITSITGLILPVEEICAIARKRGITTFVDGAHVPGHISLNLSTLGADIYTGACHKWMLTPKSCSFLYVRKALQDQFDPLVVSWGYDSDAPSSSRFLDYHQMQGTRDFSAFLTVPAAIRFMEKYEWDSVAANCRQLVKSNAPRFAELLNGQLLAPLLDDFIGQLISIPIRVQDTEVLQQKLFDQYKIEVPIMQQNGKQYLRYSINGFNNQEDLDKLFVALSECSMGSSEN